MNYDTHPLRDFTQNGNLSKGNKYRFILVNINQMFNILNFEVGDIDHLIDYCMLNNAFYPILWRKIHNRYWHIN